MKRCKVLLVVALLLLVVAPNVFGQAIAEVSTPPTVAISGPDGFINVGELVRLRATGETASVSWYVVPPTEDFATVGDRAFFSARVPGSWTFVLAFETDSGVQQVAHVVTIGEGEPPVPEPPGSTITTAQVLEWLERVPSAIRNAMIDDPITGEQYTRQEAVGRTFSDIATAAEKLGSIRATNLMLTTGLKASFGPEADGWLVFADQVDDALTDAEKRGVSPAEYGEILAVIGRALR